MSNMNNANGYENAPATLMIAVNCACCARPLLDAVSVETGMGPVCRKKHGFNTPDSVVELLAVVSTLASILPGEVYLSVVGGVSTAREAANKIVHRIACLGLGVEVAPLLLALAELGFTKLAGIMTARAATVVITRTETTVEVVAPFSEEFNARVRNIPTRRWVKNANGKGGRNVIAAAHAKALFEVLVKSFPGATAHGPKGLFTLALAA